MKVKLTKPTRVKCLSGEVEVTNAEAARLFLLNVAEPATKEKKEIPEKAERTTRKK